MEKIFDINYIHRLQSAMEAQGQPKEEISLCIDYAQVLLSRNLPVLFDAVHVKKTLRLGTIRQQEYHSFYLHQKGKVREITAPSLALKSMQRWVLNNILAKLDVSAYAHGFIKNRSIKTNATLHMHHDYVLCMDIEDFFPSISRNTVVRVFTHTGYSKSAASALADLCCYQETLPQGAHTSPYLANIIFYQIDEQLALLAREYGAIYSRYADDLTFSSNTPLDHLSDTVCTVLRQNEFRVNSQKTKLFLPGQPKRITGLIVQNGSVRIPRYFKRSLKQEIYYCKKFGVIAHLENSRATRRINYREYLYGKAYYIRMIEPELGEKYLQELDQIRWPRYYL